LGTGTAGVSSDVTGALAVDNETWPEECVDPLVVVAGSTLLAGPADRPFASCEPVELLSCLCARVLCAGPPRRDRRCGGDDPGRDRTGTFETTSVARVRGSEGGATAAADRGPLGPAGRVVRASAEYACGIGVSGGSSPAARCEPAWPHPPPASASAAVRAATRKERGTRPRAPGLMRNRVVAVPPSSSSIVFDLLSPCCQYRSQASGGVRRGPSNSGCRHGTEWSEWESN
jgi:hypothetical protein